MGGFNTRRMGIMNPHPLMINVPISKFGGRGCGDSLQESGLQHG